jgi:hypothetical protein
MFRSNKINQRDGQGWGRASPRDDRKGLRMISEQSGREREGIVCRTLICTRHAIARGGAARAMGLAILVVMEKQEKQ